LSTAADFARRARQERSLPTAEHAHNCHTVRPAPGTFVEAVYRPGFYGQVQSYGPHGADDDAVPVFWYQAPAGFPAGFTTLHAPNQLCPPSEQAPAVDVAPRRAVPRRAMLRPLPQRTVS
jgi:hypothetical protein